MIHASAILHGKAAFFGKAGMSVYLTGGFVV